MVILTDAFFAFWYILGEYFLALMGMALFGSLFYALLWFTVRR